MTLTTYVSESELFRNVTKKKILRHPTAVAFDAKAWLQAAAALDAPKPRDFELLMGALYFGESIKKLRELLPSALSEPFTLEGGTRLLVSIANEQYIVLTRKMAKANKRLARAGVSAHVEQLAQRLVSSPTGQSMTGDDHVTHLIDTLPHWLHHLRALPADKRSRPLSDPFAAARNALMLASVERGLRDLWNATLWEGHDLINDEGVKHLVPHDEDLAARWLTWHLREQANMSWEAVTDAGAMKIAGGRLPPIVPVQPRTVVRVERLQGRKPRIVVGRANGQSRRQRSHVSERDMLARVYTGIFLDEFLPATGTLALTCRELCKAWWVIADLGQVLVDEIGDRTLGDPASLALTACTWPTEALAAAIADALVIDLPRAEVILSLLTLNPPSTFALFDQSLWWTPVVPAANGRCHLLLAPLFIGNPVRLVEHWLEIGGISDQRNVKGRGKPFEANVRATLRDRAIANPMITDAIVLEHGLKRKDGSEEIDLLMRIGNTVIIGEVKCFLSPVEPTDRFNYLIALKSAAEQARRKADWVDANRTMALGALGVTDPERIAKMQLLPIVVLNQGHGLGLSIGGVPITDLHFLALIVGSAEYQSDTGFATGGMAGAMFTFYRSQLELEASLPKLLADPPPLRRYKSAITWRAEPFPSPDGKPLMIHIPSLTGAPTDHGTFATLEAILKPAG